MSPHRHTAGLSLSLTGPMYLHMLFAHTDWDTTPLPISPLTPPLQHSILQAPSVPTAPYSPPGTQTGVGGVTTCIREAVLEPRALIPCKSWDPWSPHLEPPAVSTKDSRPQPTGPSGSEEEGVTSPCCTGHPCRSAVAAGCQEENPICQDT